MLVSSDILRQAPDKLGDFILVAVLGGHAEGVGLAVCLVEHRAYSRLCTQIICSARYQIGQQCARLNPSTFS